MINNNKPIKVLYIAGFFRSGSTLMDRLLGQAENLFSIGESRFLWEESFALNQPCGCNKPFDQCEFWSTVIKNSFGEELDAKAVLELKQNVDRIRYIPQLAGERMRDGFREDFIKFANTIEKLYEGIKAVSGCDIIVDSSKDPSYAFVLNNIENIDLHIVHIVRDSRAVAHSWLRKKVKHEVGGERVYFPNHNPVKSSLSWMRQNILIELLKKRNSQNITIRYEDFMINPKETIGSILRFVQGHENNNPLLGKGCEINLETNHTVAGNPMRFKVGKININADLEWQSQMLKRNRWLVTNLSYPLLKKYGYINKI